MLTPIVLLANALLPNAVLKTPVVFAANVPAPIAVLPTTALPPLPIVKPLTNKSLEKVVAPVKVCVPLSKAIVPPASGNEYVLLADRDTEVNVAELPPLNTKDN